MTAPQARGEGVSAEDLASLEAQLGRPPRGVVAVPVRCPCGSPVVVTTTPRLDDGTPFPTLYYLTHPGAVIAVSRLEAAGVMREMEARLGIDADLAARYRAAHEAYLEARDAVEAVPEIEGVSAGGMPDRVKCLHVLVAHALVAGPGVNPFGDEALDAVRDDWSLDRCSCSDP
jgi:hypothetical protein